MADVAATRKRGRQADGRSRGSSYYFRLLCGKELMGAIIGKGGATVGELETKFGCKILKAGTPFTGTVMRALHIMGPEPQNVSDCLKEIVGMCASETQNDTYKVCFVFPKPSVGAVIGPKGATIKELRETTGAFINVEKEVNSGSGNPVPEQRGDVTGTWDQVCAVILRFFDIINNEDQRRQDYYGNYAEAVGVRKSSMDKGGYDYTNQNQTWGSSYTEGYGNHGGALPPYKASKYDNPYGPSGPQAAAPYHSHLPTTSTHSTNSTHALTYSHQATDVPTGKVLPADYIPQAKKLSLITGVTEVTTPVANADVGKLMGKSGQTIRALETETCCSIQIATSKPNENARVVTIVGEPTGVTYALMRMFNLVAQE